jgi:hypothetical protein
MKKAIIIALCIILACVAQVCVIGINGLTLLSLPITIFLGLNVIEKQTETEDKPTK